MGQKVVLFGEAEKGEFHALLHFSSLSNLAEILGHPPEESLGIHLAIQTLLYQREVIFIRVREEGYSKKDYFQGMKLLKSAPEIKKISAICIPGVGDFEVIDSASNLCHLHQSILITTEKDFYDYLTSFQMGEIN